MCLILLSWRQRADFPLVLAANRDEFHARPTAAAAFWPEAPQLLAGRDLLGGGTWLGITRAGRWAAVTNIRDPSIPRPGCASRGVLVRDFLLGDQSPGDYLREVAGHAENYAGFNLLAGDREQLGYFGSREEAPKLLPPGLYGLSNGRLGDRWPKTVGGSAALGALLAVPAPPDPQALFAILADRSRPPDEQLPATGVGLEWERLLASRFIVSIAYGTRSSTVLRFDGQGGMEFFERSFSPAGTVCAEVRQTLEPG